MEYRYADQQDWEFLSSGNILKHFSGMPAFPVRLNLELFGRAAEKIGKTDGFAVYDPCCGSGYSLAVLGLMRGGQIRAIVGSDVDPACVDAAASNLSLLRRDGILAARDRILNAPETTPERRTQLEAAVERVLPLIGDRELPANVFRHDILASPPSLPEPVDYVFADIPYGNLTAWRTSEPTADPVERMLANLCPILADKGVVAVCGTKELRVRAEGYIRRGKLRAGHRLIVLLQKLGGKTGL